MNTIDELQIRFLARNGGVAILSVFDNRAFHIRLHWTDFVMEPKK